MIVLSNEDGLFKVGDIEKCVTFMDKIGKGSGEWLLQEVSDDAEIKGEIRVIEGDR